MLTPSTTLLSILYCLLNLSATFAKDNLAIVQLFEWNWDSVARECPIMARAGYGYAQVSPPQEHITGTQWWTDYQPVSYKLISKRGNRDQFINMVHTCNAAGIGILADAVLNHMTNGAGTGFAGSSYSKYHSCNLLVKNVDSGDFHYCGLNGNNEIQNYNNQFEVWNCELVSLADLATGTSTVRQAQTAYLQDLINIGVAGFRFDAAKSIPPEDLAAIIGGLHKGQGDPLFVIQEVVFGQGQPITPQMYTGNGNVIEFRTAYTLNQYFGSGISSLLSQIPGNGWLAATSAISFVTNQDTERGNGVLTSTSANNAYVLASIYLLAQPYSVPTIFSGYSFTSYDAGAPQYSTGLTNDVTCYSNGWRCEHRWDAIRRMVRFYNKTRLPNWVGANQFQAGNSQQLSFSRGNRGHVLINNQGGDWSGNFQTNLSDGNYCDLIHHECAPGDNSPTIHVQGGNFYASVPAFDAVVLL